MWTKKRWGKIEPEEICKKRVARKMGKLKVIFCEEIVGVRIETINRRLLVSDVTKYVHR